jgi:NADP-dependent 3-hydroxy acid dehydrogenase YdfG
VSALAGRVALVTGASSGIGRAVARSLARRGASVAVSGRDVVRLGEVASSLAGRSVAIAADLGAPTGIAALAERTIAELGRLDVLVHAAGALRLGPLAEVRAEDADELYRVNLRAPLLLTRALLPALREARGWVVFVNSSAALVPSAGNGLYAATKCALASLAKTLRDEVNGDGVRVLSVFPGRTATPMQERVAAFEGDRYGPEHLLQPADVAEAIAEAILLPETAEVTDLVIRPARKPGRGAEKP